MFYKIRHFSGRYHIRTFFSWPLKSEGWNALGHTHRVTHGFLVLIFMADHPIAYQETHSIGRNALGKEEDPFEWMKIFLIDYSKKFAPVNVKMGYMTDFHKQKFIPHTNLLTRILPFVFEVVFLLFCFWTMAVVVAVGDSVCWWWLLGCGWWW